MDQKESRNSATRGVSEAYPAPAPPKRVRLVLALLGALIFSAIIFSTPAAQKVEYVAQTAAKEAVDHIPGGNKLTTLARYNPWSKTPVHEPPVQSNSSSGDAKWYSDWKWLNPFSSAITLDDTRAVLPHLSQRVPIYTYYDPDKEDSSIREEEAKLLLIWRRAWWAQGFRPIVLGKAEAMKNPHYEAFTQVQDNVEISPEIMRWLAWGHMGSGILANWLVIPMGPRDDHDLTYLRRGSYPKDDRDNQYKVKRYEDFGNAFYWGHQEAIDKAIVAILNEPQVTEKQSVREAVDDAHVFAIDPRPTGLAYYDHHTISENYKVIAEKLEDTKAHALNMLSQLITNHLHATFLSDFPDGFDVISSRPLETTLLSAHGAILSEALNTCPHSPLPQSCPPNRVECRPCEFRKVNYPGSITNSTKTFTIGTVPHPYTLAVLLKGDNNINLRYVRRNSERDPWLEKSTKDMLPPGISAYERITKFKETIVSDAGQAHGIWHTAERDWIWDDLEWRLGFTLHPQLQKQQDKTGDHGQDIQTSSTSPFPSSAARVITFPIPQPDDYPRELSPLLESLGKDSQPKREEILIQSELIAGAKKVLAEGKKVTGKSDLRRILEAWHLADTEAWRFVRAFEARARMERSQWEEEEKKYLDKAARRSE